MLYLTGPITSSVDLAYYGVSHAKDWVWIVVNEATRQLTLTSSLIYIFSYANTQARVENFVNFTIPVRTSRICEQKLRTRDIHFIYSKR